MAKRLVSQSLQKWDALSMHHLIESQNNSTRSHYLYFIDEDPRLRNAK